MCPKHMYEAYPALPQMAPDPNDLFIHRSVVALRAIRVDRSEVLLPLEPAQGEEPPDGRQVERGQPVEDHGRERALVGHAGLREAEHEPTLGDPDPARHREQPGE